MVKTKPNPMSIVTISLFYILAILGIVYAVLVNSKALMVLAIFLIILFTILAVTLTIGTIANYEECSPNSLIVHRYFKSKEYPMESIDRIEFYGEYVSIFTKDELEVCTIHSGKGNLIAFLEVLEKNGILSYDKRESKN